jgi:hypothetical protein
LGILCSYPELNAFLVEIKRASVFSTKLEVMQVLGRIQCSYMGNMVITGGG